MDMSGAIDFFAQEWAVIVEAPATFCVATVVIGTAVYLALRWRYQGQIESLNGLIVLKEAEVNDYKRKLDGATPAEAKERIDRLEQKVDSYRFRSRRSLSPNDLEIFSAVISRERNSSVTLIRDLRSPSANRLCKSLITAFQAGGWATTDHWNEGKNINAPVVLSVANRENLSAREAVVRDALTACDIPFTITSESRLPVSGPSDPIIYINSDR
jgi:hypothetical protein